MPKTVSISFSPLALPKGGTAVVFVGADGRPAAQVATLLGEDMLRLMARAATVERFKGKAGSVLTLLSPGASLDKLVVVGTASESDPIDATLLGGQVLSKVGSGPASVFFVVPGLEMTSRHSAEFALGARLSAYKFDRYKTKKEPEDEAVGDTALTLCSDLSPGAEDLGAVAAMVDGVNLARDLVNEPPNVLFPEEFARRCEALRALGVEVEVLDKARLEAIGMRTLLAVNQGSVREPRVVVMRWNGATEKGATPLAFVGKGVCFDTGGISIKPASGMEDMKGDMGGAAAVTGLMHVLAARKAKVNVVGAIGLVENMPDGAAQRPGDIVTSLSGQTIEIINTDAEGRLVLADVIWHVRETFKPRFVIDLATLTGAIIVALAQEHAGLYCNNDELAARLIAAGEATGETVWRMPIGKGYDKMIDSKFADMKNVGGRPGGSSSAAMFIKRFVGDTPWAHLDIAGTAMGSKETDINHSWGSGWGVRLLDRLVSSHYEG
ncbi:leucyl aminopeptidase [Rhizobiales bacterium GAS188]|nr:leucyl aminopeptidase [Rhizobiales bacterium GAS188]